MVIIAKNESDVFDALKNMIGLIGDPIKQIFVGNDDVYFDWLRLGNLDCPKRGKLKFSGVFGGVDWVRHVTVFPAKMNSFMVRAPGWIGFVDKKVVSFDEECG